LNLGLAYFNYQLNAELKKHSTAMAVMLYGIHKGKIKIVDVDDGFKLESL
jgi:hypothetical protein